MILLYSWCLFKECAIELHVDVLSRQVIKSNGTGNIYICNLYLLVVTHVCAYVFFFFLWVCVCVRPCACAHEIVKACSSQSILVLFSTLIFIVCIYVPLYILVIFEQ